MKLISIICRPRYFEDSLVSKENEYFELEDHDGDLIPCVNIINDRKHWIPLIDIDTGKILNWEVGKSAKIHYKVCDAGDYLITSNEISFRKIGYVPDFLSINSEEYGDYMIFNVDRNGFIENWNSNFKLNGFDLVTDENDEYLKLHINRILKFKRNNIINTTLN